MRILSIDWLRGISTPLWRFFEALWSSEVQRPGYVGGVPYLTLLRILVYFGVFLRFLFHQDEYTYELWFLLAILLATCWLIVIVDFKRSSLHGEALLRWKWRITCLDIVFISVFYFLTRKLESDFFLFYYLPIITSAEYLNVKRLQTTGVLVTLAFAATLALIVLAYGSPKPPLQIIVTHFLPREVFFILVAMVSSHLRLSDRYRSQYANQLKMMLRVRTAAYELLEDKQILDVSLKIAMEGTGAKGGLIWLATAGKQQDISDVVPESISNDSIESIAERMQPQDPGTFLLLPGGKKTANYRVISVPLLTHNASMGCLSVVTDSERRDKDDKLSFLKALAEPIGSVLEKRKLQTALNEIVRISSCAALLNHELDILFNTLTHDKRCDYAAISLVDEYMERVAMLRARNMAPRLIEMSCVNLSSKHIMAAIVRSGQHEFFHAGQHDHRFDMEIYDTFGYSEYHRLFVPLMMTGKDDESLVVGVIEAGWHKNRKPTNRIIEGIIELGKKSGKAIGDNRTYVLLEAIARRAMDIISADSASIHVYQDTETLFQAGAGPANREFLKKHPPRKHNGIGWMSINKQQPVIIDDEEEVKLRLPHVYREGVRAIAAIPLLRMSNERISGVLYLHFWRPRKFTKTVLFIEETFARQIETVIQNHLFMKKTTEALESAWHVSFFQNFIQSLATVHDTTNILNKIALNALLYLPDADCVTLYQYFGSKHSFGSPPVMQGHFHHPDKMRTEVNKDEVPWLIVQSGVSNYISDLSAHEEFTKSQHDDSSKQRFVIREGIKSSAQLVLRAHDREIVGVLFVNYRKPHTFPIEERNALVSFANAGAIAIHISRLVSEERTQRRQLDQLRKIQEEISAPRPLRDLADKIISQLQSLVSCTTASLQFLDGDQRILLAGKGFDVQNANLHFVRPISQDPLIRQAIESRTAKVISNTGNEPLWDSLSETSDVRSWICLPLIHSDEVIGILTIDHNQENAYTKEDIPILMKFAGTVAVQLRRTASYERAKQRIESLELINMVNREVSSRVDGFSWAKSITTLIREGLQCDQCTIFGKEGHNGTSTLNVVATDGKFSHFIESRSIDLNTSTRPKSPVATAFRDGRRLVLKDTYLEPSADPPELIDKRTGPRAMLLAPMISDERSIGVIVVEKNEEGYFKESHAIVLDTIARYAGVAIQKDRGFALLHQIGNQVLKATVVDDVLRDIVLTVSIYMEVDSAAICLLGDDQGKKCHITRSSTPACQLPSSDVLDKLTVLMATQSSDIIVKNNHLDKVLEIQDLSYCAIPLKIEEEAVGILYLFSCDPSRGFSEAERSLLGSLATQAALAIQKTRLHHAVKQRLLSTEKRRLALQNLLGIEPLAGILLHTISDPVADIPYRVRDTNNAISKIRATINKLEKYIDHAEVECPNHRALAELYEIREEIGDSLDEIKNSVTVIRDKSGWLSSLLDKMRSSLEKDLSEAGVISTVDISDLLSRALTKAKIHKYSEFERCNLVLDYDNCRELIETYDSLVLEAFVNIITNAVEAMINGGDLTIKAQQSIYKSEDVIEITIADNGIGIPSENIHKIFDINYSKGKKTGSGYGLWFVEHVLDAAGFYKEVESDLGVGTRFKLFVPIDRR